MCQCWETVPQDRPSFRHLADKLSKLLMPETTQYFNIKSGEYLNMNKERFKHETDYLEMVASPDIRHITRDGESKCEDGVHGTGKTNHDLQMHTESTTSDPDQRTGYLPMSSGTRSLSSSSDLFYPIMNM
ncbi:uncharacterized protein LOC135210523 [Macrobrachium nipponense]|uniref:uncharacterized protein LOC135210523 n=1 Tax=Macrobrachium nipponense TaxID=159736 RepID=UPI0030C8AAA4